MPLGYECLSKVLWLYEMGQNELIKVRYNEYHVYVIIE